LDNYQHKRFLADVRRGIRRFSLSDEEKNKSAKISVICGKYFSKKGSPTDCADGRRYVKLKKCFYERVEYLYGGISIPGVNLSKFCITQCKYLQKSARDTLVLPIKQ